MSAIYEGDKLIGYGKVVHDLTEKKKADEELTKAKNRAEVRTPLSAILGFTEILKTPGLEETEKNSYVDIIDRNGRALVHIIDDILDISKVEAGKLRLEKISFDIRHLLAEVAGLFEIRAKEKGLQFLTRIEPSVSQMVVSDPSRVRQILNNIIGNAVKFTSEGEIQVQVEEVNPDGQRPKIRIEVKDTGKGISEAEKSVLFEPFVQGDPSTTRIYGGTGLGLALSRRLARQLGGDLFVGEDCRSDEGCAFVIEFVNDLQELASDQSVEISTLPQENAEQFKRYPLPESPRFALQGAKILVVEDSDDNRALIEKLLIRAGASVDVAMDGAEGFQRALSGQFDAVVMDVQMPVLDGNDAAKKLRSAGFQKPMIALTAHAMVEEVNRCLECGFNSHLSKPVDSKKLISTLQRHLEIP